MFQGLCYVYAEVQLFEGLEVPFESLPGALS